MKDMRACWSAWGRDNLWCTGSGR